MRKALVAVILLVFFVGTVMANLTIYEAMSLGQQHGAIDAENVGFLGSALLGILGAVFMNTSGTQLPPSRVAYITNLTTNPEVIAAYENSYSIAFSNRIAANTWRGYAIGSLISSIIVFLISVAVAGAGS